MALLSVLGVVFQPAHWEGRAAGVQRGRRRLGALPERPRRLRAELLLGQGGGPSARGCCAQNLPQRLHQGETKSNTVHVYAVKRQEFCLRKWTCRLLRS